MTQHPIIRRLLEADPDDVREALELCTEDERRHFAAIVKQLTRSCNRHEDCDVADELGSQLGVYVSHCHELACEHCTKGRRHG
jgi:hypothetical protein